MLSEKEMKQHVKDEASREPDRFFPTETLRGLGLERARCPRCGTYYWSADSGRETCGEPACEGGYSFIGRKVCEHRMDFIGVWERFSALMERRGYTPIQRYPTVARWNPTTEFTLASITDFQPYVVRGEVRPPANPLVVPQTCLRFNDLDNVGITGRHNTGFVMIGQHAFESQETYDQEKYFEDIHAWLVEGMGIPLDDIVYHEDAWAGGGNFGCSLEFFSRGLEIGNQVYTMYERVGDELKPLGIKVLDMGMGQERPAWFSHGTPTAYEPNFPTVMERLFGIAGISRSGEERDMMAGFIPYSGLLNLEETDDLEGVWREIARRIGADVDRLKETVMLSAALYSVADHARALLFALTDGALPSNSGGGYNLRLIYRRAASFIDRYGWDIDLADVCEWHAEYLRPQYPEMLDAMPEVRDILEHEATKHRQSQEKARATVERLGARDRPVSADELLKLYDSHGITPDMLADAGLDVDMPPDFFARVAALHQGEHEAAARTGREEAVKLPELPGTRVLYYDDYLLLDFESTVLAVVDDCVVLDATAFYPTSGGQLHDTGTLEGASTVRVMDIFKQDAVIVHRVEGDLAGWKAGDRVKGHVDEERRRQLAQHHTVTHIINGVARKLLGSHVWQAGAEKSMEKGRLDITHYDALSQEQLVAIEEGANDIIRRDIRVESMLLPKDEAERRFGFRLYQGGAIPGDTLRVVRIDDLDTEACGGTHLHSTGEAVRVIILGTKKIQDGIVRIEYVAGHRAEQIFRSDMEHLAGAMALLGIADASLLEPACRDIFALWKRLRKASGKIARIPEGEARDAARQEVMESARSSPAYAHLLRFREAGMPGVLPAGGDIPEISRPHVIIQKAASAFNVQKEHLGRTLLRFLREIDGWLSSMERG